MPAVYNLPNVSIPADVVRKLIFADSTFSGLRAPAWTALSKARKIEEMLTVVCL
jgi:hypothetical protein